MARRSDDYPSTDYAIILTMSDHRPDVDRVEKEAQERFPEDSTSGNTSRNNYIVKELKKLCKEYDLLYKK